MKKNKYIEILSKTSNVINYNEEELKRSIKLMWAFKNDEFLLKALEDKIDNNDYENIANMLMVINRHSLLPGLQSGADHGKYYLNVLTGLSYEEENIIEIKYPKEIGKSNQTSYVSGIATNFIISLYYKDNELLDDTLRKAEIFLNKKSISN